MTIEEYNKLEQESLACNRVIESCTAEDFEHRGYPTRVYDEKQLWRYVDTMQEGRAEFILKYELFGLSDEELAIYNEIQTNVSTYTEQNFHKTVIPTGSLLNAILAWRNIRSVLPSGKVLELGGGSGYLGYILSKNYEYIATEICQAYYLWQERLLTLSGNNFQMIPYWDFYTINNLTFELDCIVVCDAITEMTQECFGYLLNRAKQWLKPNGFIYIHGTGLQRKYKFKDILYHFSDCGFKLCHSDKILTPNEHADHDLFYFFSKTKQDISERVFAERFKEYPHRDFKFSLNDDEIYHNLCKLP